MKLSTILTTSLALLAAAIGVTAGELEIETLFKPDECLLKSQKGDKLSMQYVALSFSVPSSLPIG
jgi:hypothetical protein